MSINMFNLGECQYWPYRVIYTLFEQWQTTLDSNVGRQNLEGGSLLIEIELTEYKVKGFGDVYFLEMFKFCVVSRR